MPRAVISAVLLFGDVFPCPDRLGGVYRVVWDRKKDPKAIRVLLSTRVAASRSDFGQLSRKATSNAEAAKCVACEGFLARASELTMFLLRTAAQRSFIPFDNLFIVHWKRLATCALATAPTAGFVARAIRIGGSMLESQEC